MSRHSPSVSPLVSQGDFPPHPPAPYPPRPSYGYHRPYYPPEYYSPQPQYGTQSNDPRYSDPRHSGYDGGYGYNTPHQGPPPQHYPLPRPQRQLNDQPGASLMSGPGVGGNQIPGGSGDGSQPTASDPPQNGRSSYSPAQPPAPLSGQPTDPPAQQPAASFTAQPTDSPVQQPATLFSAQPTVPPAQQPAPLFSGQPTPPETQRLTTISPGLMERLSSAQSPPTLNPADLGLPFLQSRKPRSPTPDDASAEGGSTAGDNSE